VSPAQTPAPVPSQFQGLYSFLQSKMTAFSQSLPRGSANAMVNSAQLRSASSDEGSLLLNPSQLGVVETEMSQLQALGVNSVTIHVDFPILYAPYYTNQSEFQQYQSFYSQVAALVRGAGLKLIVETQLMKFNAPQLTFAQGLSWTAYQAGRAQNAVTAAQVMQPANMVVIEEPDTEMTYSNQSSVGTVSGSTQMLQTILTAFTQAGISNVSIGAGTGTWMPSFTSWMNAFAAMPIQFLDMHIYPINNNFLQNASAAADIAHQAGKQVGLSEAWLQKVGDSELTSNVSATNARNPYSYWAPLDLQFLQAMEQLGQSKQFAFISPFWTSYFFAYLTTPGTTNQQQQAFAAAQTANTLGQFTSTGVGFERAILTSPDTSAPQIPGPPALGGLGTTVQLTWAPSSDNVGTAGYNIFRNGQLLTTTSSTTYNDKGLVPGLYTYTISAFDASGNVSPLSGPQQFNERATTHN
jgi:hypothetical protein